MSAAFRFWWMARRLPCTWTSTSAISIATSSLHGPQALWPTGIACSTASRASRRNAAVQRRRRDDPRCVEERVTYGDPPHRFEAGTPAIVQAVGLGAAIDYVNSIGKARIRAMRMSSSNTHTSSSARSFTALRIMAMPKGRADRLVRSERSASPRCRHVIDREGVAVRAGTHCVMPLLARTD